MLRDEHLPPLYHSADHSSTQAQARFLIASRVRLISLVCAALFGLFTWKTDSSPVDWAGLLAAACFVMTLLVDGYLQQTKPERTWYEGRAAAESVKTLAWRYAVGGEPFGIGRTTEPKLADLFLSQLQSLLEVVRDLDLVPPASSSSQITNEMRTARAGTLTERKQLYELARVVDQQDWYRRKAGWNRQRASSWTIGMFAIEAIGAFCAILKAVGFIEGDLLGFAGALAAAITAWLQTKQHRNLATAYAVTALELASLRTKVAHQETEDDWATFVGDAEEAFSREHTLWKASRGVQSL